MILPSTKVDFNKLAEEVTTSFFKEQEPLKKCIVTVASKEQLNPNEVQRLVELANIKATLKMLAASTDKTVEFDLANYNDVLSEIMESSEVSEESSKDTNEGKSTEPIDIPNFTEKDRMDKRPSLFDLFGVKKPEEPEKKDTPQHVIIMRLKKQAEELTQEKIASEIRVYDEYDYLVSEFSKLRSPDFNKFASDCAAVYGDRIIPVIDSLSKDIKQSYIIKEAEDISVVDDTLPVMKSVDRIVTNLTKVANLDTKIEHCQTALEENKKITKDA